MGIIRPILSPSTDEAAAIKTAFDGKATVEPVIQEQRKHLTAHSPSWVTRINEESDLRPTGLAELAAALEQRVSVLESFPVGPQRDTALDRHKAAVAVVADLRAQLDDHQMTAADNTD